MHIHELSIVTSEAMRNDKQKMPTHQAYTYEHQNEFKIYYFTQCSVTKGKQQ